MLHINELDIQVHFCILCEICIVTFVPSHTIVKTRERNLHKYSLFRGNREKCVPCISENGSGTYTHWYQYSSIFTQATYSSESYVRVWNNISILMLIHTCTSYYIPDSEEEVARVNIHIMKTGKFHQNMNFQYNMTT